MIRVLRLLGFFVLCVMPGLGQAEWPRPKWEKVHLLSCRSAGKEASSTVGNYEVRLVPAADVNRDNGCRAYLVDKAGHQTRLLADWDVSVYEGTGEDIFGSGNPALVLEGFSGGAHCCYTYQLVDLKEKPVVLSFKVGKATEADLLAVLAVVQRFPGSRRLEFRFVDTEGHRLRMLAGTEFKVAWNDAVAKELSPWLSR